MPHTKSAAFGGRLALAVAEAVRILAQHHSVVLRARVAARHRVDGVGARNYSDVRVGVVCARVDPVGAAHLVLTRSQHDAALIAEERYVPFGFLLDVTGSSGFCSGT